MTYIHNSGEQVQQAAENIQTSTDISDENKEDVKEFVRFMEDCGLSDARIIRYLQSAKKVMEHNDFRLKGADEDQLRQINRQIRDSAYYHREYSTGTKNEYRKFVRAYIKWEDKVPLNRPREDAPKRAEIFRLNQSQSAKDRTDPRELPGPKEIKLLCQQLNSLQQRAILLTHWNTGARIGETLNTKVGGFQERNGVHYLQVPGNKKSDDRNLLVPIAGPVIKLWLEEGHPAPGNDDAYLFCLTESPEVNEDQELAYRPASYRYFADQLKRAKKAADLDCDVCTHTIRKGRITYLTKKGMQENLISKQVGHIPGSEIIREYARLSDDDINEGIASLYDMEGAVPEAEKDLLPLKCADCGLVNPGYRDRCRNCQGLLEIQELQKLEKQQEEASQLLIKALKERGVWERVKDIHQASG